MLLKFKSSLNQSQLLRTDVTIIALTTIFIFSAIILVYKIIIINMIAVLASDGLWDTHTNEEAVALVRGLSRPPALSPPLINGPNPFKGKFFCHISIS